MAARSSLPWMFGGLAVLAAVAGLAVLTLARTPAPAHGSADPAVPGTTDAVAIRHADVPAPEVAPLPEVPMPEELPRIAAIAPGTQFRPSDWPPLPDLERPPAERLDQLRTRAAEGDHKAACQLAWDLGQCRQARARLADQDRKVLRVDPADAYATQDLATLDVLTQQVRHCAGMPDDDLLFWEMTRQAARAGLVAAAENYVFQPEDLFLKSRLPAAEIRRLLAERDSLLLMAAIAGSPPARMAIGQRFDVWARGLALDPDQGLDSDERELVKFWAQGGRPSTPEGVLRLDAMRAHVAARQAAQTLEQRRRTDNRPLVSRCEETYMPAPAVRDRVDWRMELGMQR